MKPTRLAVTALFAAALLVLFLPLAHAQSCGNSNPAGQSAGPDTPKSPGDTDQEKPTDEPDDNNCNGSAAGNPYNVISGSAIRPVEDLRSVTVSTGQTLKWQRNMISRTVQGTPLLGSGHNARHSYQWQAARIADSADGRPQYRVNYPAGASVVFVQMPDGQFAKPPKIREQLLADGKGNFYLQTPFGNKIGFGPIQAGSKNLAFKGYWDRESRFFAAQHDAGGRLTKMTEPGGRWLQVSYQNFPLRRANGQTGNQLAVKRVATSDGRAVDYNYETRSEAGFGVDYLCLTRADYGDGKKGLYDYEFLKEGQKPQVVRFEDSRAKSPSQRMVYSYEVLGIQGAVTAERDPDTGSDIVRLANNPKGVNVVYATGAVDVFEYNRSSALNITGRINGEKARRMYTYDAGGNGLLTDKYDALGRHFQFVRNAFGSLIGRTLPDGSTEAWERDANNRVLSYTDPLGRTTVYQRDSRGNPTHIIYPDGTVESAIYNSLSLPVSKTERDGRTTQYTYDATGLMLTETAPDGGVTSYEYNTAGWRTAVTDPLGRTTRYAYQESGKVSRITYPDGTSVAYTYDAFDNLSSMTDESGGVTTYTHDYLGRITSITDALGRTTTFEYDYSLYNNGSSLTYAGPSRAIGPDGRRIAITYDTLLRRVSMTQGAGTPDAATVRYAYDGVGNVTSFTDGAGQTTLFTRDNRDRLAATTDPLGHTTTYGYDAAGQLRQITDALSRITTRSYDAVGRVVTETNANGETLALTYDGEGRPLTFTDARGMVYSFAYDAAGRMSAKRYPDGSVESAAYNLAGEPTTRINRAGQIQSLLYDLRSRPIRATWSGAAAPATTRSYDAVGRLVKLEHGRSVLEYRYDLAGQMLSESSRLGSQPALTVDYRYDLGGRRSGLTTPGGQNVAWQFEGRGLPAVLDVDGSTMATFTYDLRGLPATRTLENGASSTYTYDAAARLQAMRGTVPVTYSLNAVGQRTGRHDAAFGPESYAYDAIDQVIGANYGGVRSEGFAYDAMGNRQSASDTAAGITAYTVRADNTYATVGGVLAAHDGNGNMTDLGEGTKGEYDAQNRLVRAERNGTVTEFEYDGFNRCLERRTTRAGGGAESLRLVYAGWDLIEERDGEGALTAQYVHGVQTDDIVAKSATSGTVYYHRDGLGSTVALSDATGQIVERYRYDVFGRVEIRSATGESLPVSLFGNRFLFTGREWLSEVGLYDYRNRVYSAELGRFLQTDPIRFSAGDGNLYRYVGNDPISNTDPSGLWQVTIGGGAKYGGIITFGKNGGQWNFGGFAGAGQGSFLEVDVNDSGCRKPGFYPGGLAIGGVGLGPNIQARAYVGSEGNSASLEGSVGGLNGGFGTSGPTGPSLGFGKGAAAGFGGVAYQ